MKIGRLGRNKKHKGISIGGEVLKWAIGHIHEISEKTGIRFITVDAYPGKVSWYESFGFVKNQHKDYGDKENVSMRYDLHNPEKE